MSGEILTLQFGHYSNFVGTHWWNIQESGFQYDPDSPSEINHDVLFREGFTLKGEVTFTPRLLLVDLKGSLKTLRQDGELYKLSEEVEIEDVEVVAEEKVEKNEFLKDLGESSELKKKYDLDSQVGVWSDFLYTRFHPRSVNVVKEYQHNNENTPFDIFPLGTNLWKKVQFCEDFSDKIRNYVEECDHFQGFQVLNDSFDGFGGLSNSCLEHLKDEYDTKHILSFPLITQPTKNPICLINLALNYDGLAEHSSLFIPLSNHGFKSNFITLKPDLNYHSSAILASALDTLSLSYRLKNNSHSLVDLCSDFTSHGRKAAASSLCLPFPLKNNEDFIDCLDSWEGPLTHALTPNCEISPDESSQLVTLRGVPECRLKRPLQVQTKQRDMPAYRCDSLKEMLKFYLDCSSYRSRSEVTVCGEQMKVTVPFPKFFDARVGRTGEIDEGGEVERVSVLAGLHSGKFVGDLFRSLGEDLEKVKFKRFHQFVSEGVEGDEFKEVCDRLLDLQDCYDDNYLI